MNSTSLRGSGLVGDREEATVGMRVVAYLIDAGIVLVLSFVAAGLLFLGERSDRMLLFVWSAIPLVIIVGYAVMALVGLAGKGGTPGHRARDLLVLDSRTGRPIGFGRALLRQFVLGLLGPLNLIQLVTIDGHERRQGWHDRLAGSIVWGPEPQAPLLPPLPPAGRLIAAPMLPTSQVPVSLATSAAPPDWSTPAPVPAQVPTPPPVPAPSPVPPPVPAPPHVPTPSPPRVAAAPGLELVSTAGAISLTGLVLAGRDPQVALVAGARPWVLDDPQRSVSKTHALFGLTNGAAWVEDRHSTNGVVIARAGLRTEIAPSSRVSIEAGDEVFLGEYSVHVKES